MTHLLYHRQRQDRWIYILHIQVSPLCIEMIEKKMTDKLL